MRHRVTRTSEGIAVPLSALGTGAPTEEERVNRALEDGVPHIYVNGFMNVLTNSDVMTVLEENGRPAALMNMSFTTAKTLAVALSQVVAQLEQVTGRDMLTTHDVDRLMGATKQ